MYPQYAGDPQQRRDPRVSLAGFHVLVHGSAQLCGEEHGLLGPVLADPLDADTVADGAALREEPGVVNGQVGHPRNAGAIMIISQPGEPGLL